MQKRKLFSFRHDWKVLLVALVVAAAFYLIGTPLARKAPVAVIEVNGREVMRLTLQTAKDQVFSIQEETGVVASLEVKEQRIRFVEVACPDHICERTGFVGKPGESAVCMPNKTILSIRAAEELA